MQTRRTAIRCFVLVTAAVIAFESVPRKLLPLTSVREGLSAIVNRLGLWQYEWSLFAPDPKINNGWYSAEIIVQGETVAQWSSPYWASKSTVEKFHRFREMNYYNRISIQFPRAVDDLQTYIQREMLKQAPELSDLTDAEFKLYRNTMQLVLPDDGTLPGPEEATWVSSTQLVRQSKIDPSKVCP